MTRFTINLSTQTTFDRRSVNILCSALLFSLSFLLLLNGRNLFITDAALTRMNRQMEASPETSPLPALTDKDMQALKSQVDFANKLIYKKTKNMLLLLNHLEQVTPEGVVLTSLHPAEKDGLLKLEGNARNFPLIQTYLRKLNASGVFREPLLLSQTLSNNSPNQEIGFSISCKVSDL